MFSAIFFFSSYAAIGTQALYYIDKQKLHYFIFREEPVWLTDFDNGRIGPNLVGGINPLFKVYSTD